MYARLMMADMQADKLDGFLCAFGEQWLPQISQTRGFKALYLMRGAGEPRMAALVLWETEADAVTGGDGTLPGGEVMEVVLRA
jgi:heme-degrading monooxygenase HmoA